MARPSTALQPFYFALILVIVGMCSIPAEVQCSSSSWSRVYHGYLRARRSYEDNYITSPPASPLESWHGTTHNLASRRNVMQIAITAFPGPVSPAAAEMGPQQQRRQRLYRIPRSDAYSMLPRGSVYSPPGPSLGSNSILPPPDQP